MQIWKELFSNYNIWISEETQSSLIRATISGHGPDGEFANGIYYNISPGDIIKEIWRDDCGASSIISTRRNMDF